MGQSPPVLQRSCTWWLGGAQPLPTGPPLGASGEAASHSKLIEHYGKIFINEKTVPLNKTKFTIRVVAKFHKNLQHEYDFWSTISNSTGQWSNLCWGTFISWRRKAVKRIALSPLLCVKNGHYTRTIFVYVALILGLLQRLYTVLLS